MNAEIIGAILQGVCEGDDVSLTNRTGTFASANVGSGISVTSNMSLTGSHADNYTLTQPLLAGNITQKSLAANAVQPISTQKYNNGLEVIPTIEVKDGSVTLVADVDYTASYSNNTELGTEASVTVIGKGNYTGTAAMQFEISDDVLPTETFEGGTNGWVFVNGAQTNKWMIGTATSYAGSSSAYISNNGSANAYTITSSSTVHMYKDIEFPVSDIDFSMTYYFKGNGEARYDYMTLRYSATSSTPTAGSLFSSATCVDSIQGVSSWTKRNITLPASDFSGKTMRLVFTWRNDNSGGTQPPAAIDDIEIFVHLGAVSAPTLASKTHNSIIINAVAPPSTGQEVEYARSTANSPPASASSWQTALEFTDLLPNTDYYIFARAKADSDYTQGPASAVLMATTDKAPPATLPFTETFENEANRKGWTIVNGGQANEWIFGTAAKYAGSYSAYISNNGTSNAYTIGSESTSHIYRDIEFPASNSDFTLTFYFRGNGKADNISENDYMELRYANTSVTPDVGASLTNSNSTSLGIFANTSSWTQKTITLPASTFKNTTKRFVFTWINIWNTSDFSGYQPPAAIDDIVITAPGLSSSSGWSSSSNPSSSSVTLSSSSSTLSSSSVSSSSVQQSSSSMPSSSSSEATPIRLPQIVTGNNVLQIQNGINLQVIGNAVVEIYNLDGKLISKQNFTRGVYNVSLGSLPKGLYVVKATFGSEKKVLKALVR